MKEKLYTIPLNDAVGADDECPLCWAERKIEQDALDFTLGSSSSYMEQDIRAMTDREGFCRRHFRQMFEYGNALGSAWILSTHLRAVRSELDREMAKHKTGRGAGGGGALKMFAGFRRPGAAGKHAAAETAEAAGSGGKDSVAETAGSGVGSRRGAGSTDSVASWIRARESSCFVCNQIEETRARYLQTFFYLWRKDGEFRRKIENGKGFCLPHFGDLCEAAGTELPESEREEFYQAIFGLMQKNLERITGDVDWMIEKFDYQNVDKDWKNSRDAVQRAMQKLKGGYPADSAYRMKK